MCQTVLFGEVGYVGGETGDVRLCLNKSSRGSRGNMVPPRHENVRHKKIT